MTQRDNQAVQLDPAGNTLSDQPAIPVETAAAIMSANPVNDDVEQWLTAFRRADREAWAKDV